MAKSNTGGKEVDNSVFNFTLPNNMFPPLTPIVVQHGYNIIFYSQDRKEMLKLCEDGKIYVEGRFTESDKEVVDGLRKFLKSQFSLG